MHAVMAITVSIYLFFAMQYLNAVVDLKFFDIPVHNEIEFCNASP